MELVAIGNTIRAAAVTLASLGIAVGLSASAEAATFKVTTNCDVPWFTCSEGDLHLLYNSKKYALEDGNIVSSWSTFYGNVYNYRGTSRYQGSTFYEYRYVFNGSGNGSGQYMKNNAASVRNCSSVDNCRVYYNSGYGGASQYFGKSSGWSCDFVDLVAALKNNNASQYFA